MRTKKEPFNIKTLDESLREKYNNGEITIREAAVEFYEAGWTNYIDVERTRRWLIQKEEL